MNGPVCRICGAQLLGGSTRYCSDDCRTEGENRNRRRRRRNARKPEAPIHPLGALEFQRLPADRLLREYTRRGYQSDWSMLQRLGPEQLIAGAEA